MKWLRMWVWPALALALLLAFCGALISNGCRNARACEDRGYVWVPTHSWSGGVCVTGYAP